MITIFENFEKVRQGKTKLLGLKNGMPVQWFDPIRGKEIFGHFIEYRDSSVK